MPRDPALHRAPLLVGSAEPVLGNRHPVGAPCVWLSDCRRDVSTRGLGPALEQLRAGPSLLCRQLGPPSPSLPARVIQASGPGPGPPHVDAAHGPAVTRGLAFSSYRVSRSHLHGAVLGAGSKLVARVGEAEVQDLVGVLLESLHLHAGHCVIEPPKLLVPGGGRCVCVGVSHWGPTPQSQGPDSQGPALPTLWPPSQALRFEAQPGCPRPA